MCEVALVWFYRLRLDFFSHKISTMAILKLIIYSWCFLGVVMSYSLDSGKPSKEQQLALMKYMFCTETQNCAPVTMDERIQNEKHKIVIIVHDWEPTNARNNPAKRDQIKIMQLIASRAANKYDAILLDWSALCKYEMNQISDAADVALLAGKALANFLLGFRAINDYDTYGAIGVGLGVHVTNIALTLIKTGKWGIPSFFFAVDPLGPIFASEYFVYGKLYSRSHYTQNSAQRVMVLHCNPGQWSERKFGTHLDNGHYDIYVDNYVFDRYCSSENDANKIFEHECFHRICVEYFLANMLKMDIFTRENNGLNIHANHKETNITDPYTSSAWPGHFGIAISWPEDLQGTIDFSGESIGNKIVEPGKYFVRYNPWTYANWFTRSDNENGGTPHINVTEPAFIYYNPGSQIHTDVTLNYVYVHDDYRELTPGTKYRHEMYIGCVVLLSYIISEKSFHLEDRYVEDCPEYTKLKPHIKYCKTLLFENPENVAECFTNQACTDKVWLKKC